MTAIGDEELGTTPDPADSRGPDDVGLADERDFLLRSLDDLERERAAGDVDEDDYRSLRDDYTARAATVLRRLDAGSTDSATGPAPRSRARVLGGVLGVVALAVVAGLLVTQASGRRSGGGLTGLDVTAASGRIGDCQILERDGDPGGAMDCYGEILDALPANAEALTYRGWLQIREFDVDDGLADLDAAIQLVPDGTAPYLFRSIGRARGGDPPGAVADLAAFYDNEPSDEEATLAADFTGTVVDRALDACISGDVGGTMGAVDIVACYRDVLTVDDDNATAQVYLGWLLARSGVADDEALSLLDAGLSEDPTVTAGYVFRAALLAHLGEIERAIDDLDRFDGLEVPPDQASAAASVRAAIAAGDDPLPG